MSSALVINPTAPRLLLIHLTSVRTAASDHRTRKFDSVLFTALSFITVSRSSFVEIRMQVPIPNEQTRGDGGGGGERPEPKRGRVSRANMSFLVWQRIKGL